MNLERIEDPWGDVWCRAEDVEKLEESHLEMFGLIKQFIDDCNTAPPMEVMQRIADLIEPMQNVLNKIEGTK
jgi:sulfur relay (sulfurtransferase) DsrC/TusE family protein